MENRHKRIDAPLHEREKYLDIDSDCIGFMGPNFLFIENLLNGKIKKYSKDDWHGLSACGVSACIVIAVLGEDSKGEKLHAILHLSAVILKDMPSKLKSIMASFDCNDMEILFYGGNNLSTKMRNELFFMFKDLSPVDCQTNPISSEGFGTDIYISEGKITFYQDDPDEWKLELESDDEPSVNSPIVDAQAKRPSRHS